MVHLSEDDLDLDYSQVAQEPDGDKKAALYILYGLTDDGEHHKQWCLEKAAEALGIDLAAINEWLTDNEYAEITPGIAP